MADEFGTEEDQDLYGIDEDAKKKLRAQGAANIMETLRQSIGDEAAEALGEQIAEGVNDPLTAIEAKAPESRSRIEWGSLYGAGRVDWEAIPEATRREMDMRS